MTLIRLVTFDIFGTLLDWQSYVEQAFPGRFAAFLGESAERQEPGRAMLPYRRLLFDVGTVLDRRAAPAALNFFADSFGYAKPFTDTRALQSLRPMAMLGAVSNCDHRHLLDVQKSLDLLFDLSLLAEDLQSYKPHPEAWDAAFDHLTRRLNFDRRSWLHVSASEHFDLAPAKERGIRTCFIARPGGSTSEAIQRLAPDHAISDLWELVDLVGSINGAPVRYAVRALCADEGVARDVHAWIEREHGPELLGVRGCQAFTVLGLSPREIQCEYLFTNQAALDDYARGPALELRQKSQSRFAPGAVRFERSTATVLGGGHRRARTDFAPDQ